MKPSEILDAIAKDHDWVLPIFIGHPICRHCGQFQRLEFTPGDPERLVMHVYHGVDCPIRDAEVVTPLINLSQLLDPSWQNESD